MLFKINRWQLSLDIFSSSSEVFELWALAVAAIPPQVCGFLGALRSPLSLSLLELRDWSQRLLAARRTQRGAAAAGYK